MVQLLELGAGPLAFILRHLPVQDLARASEVCRTLHAAAQDDTIWLAKALERYPAASVCLQHYPSYQALVRDDNAEHATLLLPLEGQSCVYKLNRPPSSYYQCLLLGLEWHRAQQTFRLYLEARGEADLRQPGESSLGLMVRRTQPADRRQLAEQLKAIAATRRQLLAELAAAESADAADTIARLSFLLGRNSTQRQYVEMEMRRPLELSFADLLTVVRPSGQQLVVDRTGHKLGCLEFDSLDKVDSLLAELPDSYASKRQAQQRGLDLAFCYANPIPVMPQGALVDYEPCILASLPPGATLRQLFRSHGRYCVPGQLLTELAAEGQDERQRRWEHLPPLLLNRQPPWMV